VETNAPGARHELVGSDVFEALRRFASEGRRFDVVLADPPTFSSSKASGAFSVRDDYRSLARASLRVLAPGGLLVAATNSRTMEDDAFLRLLHDAAEMERAHLRVVELMGQPADHPSLAMVPETRHLLVAFLHVTHDARSD
jgi:23S rRNA (cytosine1962-C5)-methyltransferase